MSYTKQTWEDLPSTNTPITAARLSHMEDGIYDASEQITNSYSTSTTKGYSANYINNTIVDVYSTSETLTNKIDTDNKPIYRKVFLANNLGNNSTISITHGISNLYHVTTQKLTWYDTEDQAWYTDFRYDNTTTYVKIGRTTSSASYINCLGVNWSTRTSNVRFVLEYTKSS